MKFLERLVLWLYAFVNLIVFFGMFIITFKLDPTYLKMFVGDYPYTQHILYGIMGVCAFQVLVSLRYILSDIEFYYPKDFIEEVEYEGGKMSIKEEAFENIVLSVVGEFDYTKDTRVRVYNERKGLYVKVITYVLNDINISELSKVLQEKIAKKIEEMTNVKVARVNVIIKDVFVNQDKD